MTNDTYISGLCRINKHAEQLSILRGIDRRGSTSAEKHLVALFSVGMGGTKGGTGAGETAHSLLDYHKPPSTVNNQKPFYRNCSIRKYFLKQTQRRRRRTQCRLTVCENMHDPVNWVGGYFDCSTCTCLHGSCVLCMS